MLGCWGVGVLVEIPPLPPLPHFPIPPLPHFPTSPLPHFPHFPHFPKKIKSARFQREHFPATFR
ncbi:hypothetical protein [Microcystis sp. M53602_WE12]|uniref:hypothetical protein n=1 Tax=Microcystis sp. M53602_WE12 TaxID=3030674 RepID=UPI00258A1717|nr:hypothetical protein [Microcystis sp. M53602_WE12]MDJ0604053.1 hypothetical protein [Microcystis sp. M53602_WE12]